MINVYDSKCTDFNNNGLVVLNDTISCNATEELNGNYELELEYPLNNNKWQHLTEGNIIKADGQLYRIYHKLKTSDKIRVNARHIFYDLLDNLLEDVRPTNVSGAGALDWILTHTQYKHKFVGMGDVGGKDTRYFVRKNPVEAIMDTDGIIETWGGELVRDNFTIKLLKERGQDKGVLIAYGKNILGIEETLDIDGICTRLMPIGSDGLLLSEKYIDSPYIDNFSHPKIKVVEFNDIEDEAELRTVATKYMEDNKIDIPQFNYKVDFIELSKTEEYKNYSILETVYMGDTVTIKHSKLGLDLKAKVIKITKNVLTDKIVDVELGSFKQNIASVINNNIQAVKRAVDNTKSHLQTAIDNATNQINSAMGGHVLKRNGELLIMNTEDINTATELARWNLNGLGFSNKGYSGEFRTAITRDGHIVADFIDTGIFNADLIKTGSLNADLITSGTLNADLIKTGCITSKEGKVKIDITEDTINIGNKITFDGTELVFSDDVLLKFKGKDGVDGSDAEVPDYIKSTYIDLTQVASPYIKTNLLDIRSPDTFKNAGLVLRGYWSNSLKDVFEISYTQSVPPTVSLKSNLDATIYLNSHVKFPNSSTGYEVDFNNCTVKNLNVVAKFGA